MDVLPVSRHRDRCQRHHRCAPLLGLDHPPLTRPEQRDDSVLDRRPLFHPLDGDRLHDPGLDQQQGAFPLFLQQRLALLDPLAQALLASLGQQLPALHHVHQSLRLGLRQQGMAQQAPFAPRLHRHERDAVVPVDPHLAPPTAAEHEPQLRPGRAGQLDDLGHRRCRPRFRHCLLHRLLLAHARPFRSLRSSRSSSSRSALNRPSANRA